MQQTQAPHTPKGSADLLRIINKEREALGPADMPRLLVIGTRIGLEEYISAIISDHLLHQQERGKLQVPIGEQTAAQLRANITWNNPQHVVANVISAAICSEASDKHKALGALIKLVPEDLINSFLGVLRPTHSALGITGAGFD